MYSAPELGKRATRRREGRDGRKFTSLPLPYSFSERKQRINASGLTGTRKRDKGCLRVLISRPAGKAGASAGAGDKGGGKGRRQSFAFPNDTGAPTSLLGLDELNLGVCS